LLRWCFEKDPQRRVESIADILSALDRARHEGPAKERPGLRRTIRSLAVLPFANVSGDPQLGTPRCPVRYAA